MFFYYIYSHITGPILKQKRLKRLSERAIRITRTRALYAKRCLERAAALRPLNADILHKLPSELSALYAAALELPPADASQTELSLPESGKRQWESGKMGYANWAATQLVMQSKKADKADVISDTGASSISAAMNRNVPWEAAPDEVREVLDSL
jgi:hypothetical protein